MTAKIYTINPSGLYGSIIEYINGGNADTWGVTNASDGKPRLMHTPAQWRDKVILYLVPKDEYIGVITQYWRGQQPPTDSECGIVLGRFVEFLFVNFVENVSRIEVAK